MDLLKGSSNHGTTSIQNLSDTVYAWMRLSYQNMCGTWKTMVLITTYHEKSTKGLTIPMWLKTLRSLFVGKSFHHLCGSRHFTKKKELNWFPGVTTEINFYWPKLRNNRHGVVFNCLLQFLYKDTEQNWHILCCSFLLGTCGTGCYLPLPLLIKFHGFNS